MCGVRSLSPCRRRVQPSGRARPERQFPCAVIAAGCRRLGVMSSLIPMDVLCLHVAGGTADECVKLVRAFGSPGQWRERSPDEWRIAGLPKDLVQLLFSDL